MLNRKRETFILTLAAVLLLVGTPSALGGIISTAGSVEQLAGGSYDGWYRYTYDVEWEFDKGLSHVDFIMKPGCAADDHLVVFDTDLGGSYDGESFSPVEEDEGGIVFYEGEFNRTGDPSTGIEMPVIKYEPIGGEPGKRGSGTFWFVSNVIPEQVALSDRVAAKAGPRAYLGPLTGAYPSCNVPGTGDPVPEPATLALVGLGAALTWISRRRRQG